MKDNIEGKVIVITGASSGLGEAAAKHLSALGATVVLGASEVEHFDSAGNRKIVHSGGIQVQPDLVKINENSALYEKRPRWSARHN